MPQYHKNIISFSLISYCIILLGCSSENESSPNILIEKDVDFVKTLGGSKNDVAKAITKTMDGGYAILGHTQSADGDVTDKDDTSFDYWLIKFNENDELEWQKTYGGSNDDRGNDLLQTNDGNYIITGFGKSTDGDITNNAGNEDFWVAQLNNTGNIIWQTSLGFSGSDIGNAIIQTNDGGYLVTGTLDVTASNGEGNSKVFGVKHAGGNFWAVKLNTDGSKAWSKFYGGTFTDTPQDVIQTTDNGFIIVGSSDSIDVDINNNKGDYDFWVIKISETGSLLWERSFGGSEIDEAWGITSSNDGNYFLVGDTRSNDIDVSNNKGGADILLIKMSPQGNLIWQKTLGGSSFDAARSINKTQDGGFLISGNSRSTDGDILNNNGQNDALLLKIDANGTLLWQTTIGGSNIDLTSDATELSNGAIIAVGESSSSNEDIKNNKGFTDLLIFKI